mmetsp:Transcript_103675/g.317443  ORF Transcript_103675/g.317443 Transcript_103675/m.317443 type:complete len:211 (-) Transcript_103675:423-1055(-)
MVGPGGGSAWRLVHQVPADHPRRQGRPARRRFLLHALDHRPGRGGALPAGRRREIRAQVPQVGADDVLEFVRVRAVPQHEVGDPGVRRLLGLAMEDRPALAGKRACRVGKRGAAADHSHGPGQLPDMVGRVRCPRRSVARCASHRVRSHWRPRSELLEGPVHLLWPRLLGVLRARAAAEEQLRSRRCTGRACHRPPPGARLVAAGGGLRW